MQIRIKLMGMLKEKSPTDGKLSLGDHASIKEVLDALKIPADSVQVFTVNGTLVQDRSYQLADDDELTVLPPVGGG